MTGSGSMPRQFAAIGQPRLGLPPVVDHRHAEQRRGPVVRVGVEALAGEEQVRSAEIVRPPSSAASGSSFLIARNAVGAVNSASHPVLRDHAPERARIGRPDRLALVEHRRAAGQQRRVDDVGVADHPADVGGRPEDLARVRRRRRSACSSASATACPPLSRTTPFGQAGRAGRVEDVERIGGRAPARSRAGAAPAIELAPVEVAARRSARPRACGRCRITQCSGSCAASLERARRAAACRRRRACPSMPHDAESTTFGRASSMRTASSCGAKPPNTTEWTAPSRAHASIAKTASGTIGM